MNGVSVSASRIPAFCNVMRGNVHYRGRKGGFGDREQNFYRLSLRALDRAVPFKRRGINARPIF